MSVFNLFCDDQKLKKNGGVGYTETIKTAASVTLTSINNIMNFVPISGRPVSLVEGRTYTVSVASDDPDAHFLLPTTECVCVDMSGGAGEAFVIGNQALFDANESEDTGEWFMILEALQEGEWMTMALWGIPSMSATDSITANVTSPTETVHTIDPKYITKEIDLAKYNGNRDGMEDKTLEDALLLLLANGGGNMTLTGGNLAEFWGDISTNRPVKVMVHLDEIIVSTQSVTICTYNGNGAQLAVSTTMNDESFGGLFTLSYAICGNGVSDEATIVVKLT